MIPRKDPSYYRLPAAQRVLYLTGMPLAYVNEAPRAYTFRNERTSRGTQLTAAMQRACLEEFRKVPPGEQQFTLFSSNPTDHEALLCCTEILRFHCEKNRFFQFEFVAPSEPLPQQEDPQDRKHLYILLGVNFQDEQMTHLVRRWVRAPHGSAIWVIGAGSSPLEWAQKKLGIRPDFLFSLKETGTSLG
jgi:hypothetical protein